MVVIAAELVVVAELAAAAVVAVAVVAAAAAGSPALRQCHRRAARGALPQEHWLGNRPGNWWIRRRARN